MILSPEIEGPRIGEARPEWQVFGELAARVRPELAERLRFAGTAGDPRARSPQVVPLYAGIAELREGGDSFQYGGPHLLRRAATSRPPTGKAHFAPVAVPPSRVPADGRFAALDPARQAVQLDGPGARATRSPAPSARRC